MRWEDEKKKEDFEKKIDERKREILIERLENKGGIVVDIEEIEEIENRNGMKLIVENKIE